MRHRLLLLLPTTTYRAEAFVEAATRLGVDLMVASEEDSAFSASRPDGLVTIDFRSAEHIRSVVNALSADNRIDAVFGVDDETVVAAAIAAEALGVPHISVAAARAAGDKHVQRQRLAAAGVPVPAFARHRIADDPRAVAENLTYAVVLKPLHLSASRGVMRADTPAEFVQRHRRLRSILDSADVRERGGEEREWYLVEQFVPGPEFALEGLIIDGRLHVLALWDKPDPLDGPFFAETIYVTPSRHPQDVQDAVIGCARRAAAALGIDRGPVHVELRHNDRGPWLIELAARPIGGRCGQALRFGPHGGMSLEEVVLAHALGLLREVPGRMAEATGVMMVPVPHAGRLVRIDGIDDARRVAGVTDVAVTAHRGQRVAPLPEQARYPAFIFARGSEPAEVEAALREAHACLRPEYAD